MADGAGPAKSQFLDQPQITALCKKPDEATRLEQKIREVKSKYLKVLEETLGSRAARLEITVYVGLLVRCQFAKPWPEDLEPPLKMPLGNMTDQKIHDLGVHWAKVVDLKNPGLGFAKKGWPEGRDPRGS